jgi:hypothetical protein
MPTPSESNTPAPAPKPRGEGFPLGGTLRAIVIAIALGEAVILALGIYPTLGR